MPTSRRTAAAARAAATPTTRVTRSEASRSLASRASQELPDVVAVADRTYGGSDSAEIAEDISRQGAAPLGAMLARAMGPPTTTAHAATAATTAAAATTTAATSDLPGSPHQQSVASRRSSPAGSSGSTTNLVDAAILPTGGSQSHVRPHSVAARGRQHSSSPSSSGRASPHRRSQYATAPAALPWRAAILFAVMALLLAPLCGLLFNEGLKFSNSLTPAVSTASPAASASPAPFAPAVPHPHLPTTSEPVVAHFHSPDPARDAAIKRGANYFSPSLGAMVDPRLSSPTEKKFPSTTKMVVGAIFGILAPMHNPHIAALMPWTEAGECWCSSASAAGDSKAQLAVDMAFAVVPEKVVIEHVPSSAAPSVDSAPQKVEAWVPIADDELREKLARGFPGLFQTSQDTPEAGLPKEFLRVGRWTMNPYVTHTDEHDLELPAEFAEIAGKDAAVKKMVLRVVKNHGAPYTCIYRARLHGKAASVSEQDFGW